MKDPDLWTRVRGCHPDDVDADLPFSKRLARENGWTENFARRVIVEYLRFAYLSRLGKGMVTPSDEVDQAWHLHLTYTRHYWGPFKQALGGPLHHMPTKGGPDQATLFTKAYAETRALYRAEFGEPPPDIWPSEEIRFGKAPHFKRVNAQDVWLIRKPRLPETVKTGARRLATIPARAWRAVLMVLSLGFGTGLALAHGEPAGDTLLEKAHNMVWHWALEHTLVFAICVFVIAFVLWAILGKASGGKSGCGSSGCGSSCGSDSGGGSGCGGCGGGD